MAFLHSIRFKIVLVLGATLAVVWLSDRYVVHPQIVARALALGQDRLLARATQLAGHVELLMGCARDEMEAMARAPAMVSMEKARLDAFLAQMDELTPIFNYFFVTDPAGRWISYPRRPELVGQLIPEENRDWVHRAVASRDTVFLDVVRSRVGSLVSGFATPVIRADGTVVGVLRGVLVVSAENTAAELIARVARGADVRAFVVAGNGWLLAHTEEPIDYERYTAIDFSSRPAVQRLRAGEAGVAVEELGGARWLVAHAPVPSTDWGVVVERPESAFLERAEADATMVRRLFFGGFLVCTLLLLLGLQTTLRPLSRLAGALTAGREPPATRSRDEIGVLTRQLSLLYQQLIASREALRASEEKYRSIVQQSGDGILIVDAAGRLSEWNQSMEHLTGRPAAEVLGRPMWDVQLEQMPAQVRSEEHRAAIRQRFERLLLEPPGRALGVPGSHELTHADGTTRYIKETVFPIQLTHGRLLGGIVHDLTENRRLEEQLRHSEKMLAVGQLAGGVAHDFNNQLGGIMGFADLLRAELSHEPRLAVYADNIVRSARRSAELTAQLLAFARKGRYVDAEVDVHRLIGEVVSVLGRTLDKRIVIEQRLRAQPPLTRGDPTQLQSALLNLAVNARDAMPTGGRLEIATDLVTLDGAEVRGLRIPCPPGRYLRVAVVDSGVGMTGDVLQRVFEPFFTTKPPGRGTGMGMAAVYGAVQSHRGSIAVQSAPGSGTTVEVFLPAIGPNAADDAPAPAAQPLAGSGRILVVDDEPEVREATVLLLRAAGYDATSCAGGRAAVELFAAGARYDLVLLDLIMPEMGGSETFHTLRMHDPHVRVLLCSGYSRADEADTLLGAGAVGFIQKPYDAAELSRQVAEALAHAAPRPPHG